MHFERFLDICGCLNFYFFNVATQLWTSGWDALQSFWIFLPLTLSITHSRRCVLGRDPDPSIPKYSAQKGPQILEFSVKWTFLPSSVNSSVFSFFKLIKKEVGRAVHCDSPEISQGILKTWSIFIFAREAGGDLNNNGIENTNESEHIQPISLRKHTPGARRPGADKSSRSGFAPALSSHKAH